MVIESFKTYERGTRAQVPEEIYNKGMQYTNAPLQEGYCKLLLNYDIKNNGDILSPRPGLSAYELVKYAEAPLVEYTDTMLLVKGLECTEENGVTYKQLIIGDSNNDGLYALTNAPKAEAGLVSPGKISILTSSARFRIPEQASIHNIAVLDPLKTARHVGTFAYNNSYYYFDDDGLQHTKLNEDLEYAFEGVTPRVLTPSEAVMWGYNMLRPNPYLFENTMLGFEGPIYLEGALPYDADNHLALSPQVNQALHFECFYKGYLGKVYTVVWEWKEPGSATWTTLKTETVTIAADKKLLCDFSVPNNSIMLRITATNTSVATDMQVLTIGFDFAKSAQGNAANSKQAIYDLKDASVMAFWKNRLVIAYKDKLFLSEVNDPSYIPYPNNMEPFSETIIHILTYLDSLLIFTASKLYVITLSPDGLTWYVKNIQGNLDIKDCDIHLIQVVKNMVFFKSGNYYYMVVPKASSTTGELTIAPVSRPIEPLLDNFQAVIDNLLEKVYNYKEGVQLLHYYNFLDFEDVHNVYTFQTTKNVFVNIALLYNTVLRVWRIYLYESQHIVQSFKQDATTKGSFMALLPIETAPCVQFLKFNSVDCVDHYLAPEQATPDIFFKNFQMLDTGYRDINSNLKKRFREAQLKLNNRSGKSLQFYTEFFVDGDTRKMLYKYTPHHETDPANPSYGLLTMERELVDPSILPGATILGETETDYNYWALDVSQFPETDIWKIRIPFSGKGYAARMILVSYNQDPYELLNNVWVFRQLYSR